MGNSQEYGKKMLYSFDLKQCSTSGVPSIYPRGELPCCFACQSVASSPDSNEGCHWEAEGINWLYKGRKHRRCEGGHHMKRLKHEAKHNTLLSWRILTGDQKNKQHMALGCSFRLKKTKQNVLGNHCVWEEKKAHWESLLVDTKAWRRKFHPSLWINT